MRKKVMLISGVSVALVAVIITGTVLLWPCSHQWEKATCTDGQVCSQKEGEALGHKWLAATCQRPLKCVSCGKTQGSKVGHYYVPDPDWNGSYNVCIYCNKNEPNIHCRYCNFSMFTTGVGVDGFPCPKCGRNMI